MKFNKKKGEERVFIPQSHTTKLNWVQNKCYRKIPQVRLLFTVTFLMYTVPLYTIIFMKILSINCVQKPIMIKMIVCFYVFFTCEDLWCGRVGNDSSVLWDGAHLRFWCAAGRRVSQWGHHHPGLQLQTCTQLHIHILISVSIFKKMKHTDINNVQNISK